MQYWELVQYVLRTARHDVRIAFGVAGAAGIWYRAPLVEQGFWGILLLLAAYAAAVLGLWSIGEAAWGARPVIRFRSMADRTDRLTAEFGACAEDGSDRARLVEAVQEMLRLVGDLAALRVHVVAIETDSDDPAVIAEVSRRDRDKLRRLAYLMREGDLQTARAHQDEDS